jgi:hypothetical protein
MAKKPEYMTDQDLIDELEWLAKNREMTESRGMVKPVIDPKVKLDAIKMVGQAKGMEGFKGTASTEKQDRTDWNELKKALAKDKKHGEKKSGS